MVDDRVIQHRLNRHINIGNIGDDGPDAQRLEIEVGATAHAPAQYDIAILDSLEHLIVRAARAVTESLAPRVLPVLMTTMPPVGRVAKVLFG